MPENPMTVQRFFFGRRQPKDRVDRRLGRPSELTELQEGLRKELGKVRWKVVAREIGKQIDSLLDFDVVERILAPAWQRWELLQEYRDRKGEVEKVQLLEHTVTASHLPYIDVLFRHRKIGESLQLEVDLELDLHGVELNIRDGRIWAITAGSATGRGWLSCSYAGHKIYTLGPVSRGFELDAGIDFEDGIEIPAIPQVDLELE